MRVLIGYDGSPSADEACDLVAAASWPATTELRLVAAYQLYLAGTFYAGGVVDAATADTVFEAEREVAQEHLAAATARIGHPDLSITTAALDGRPASVIVEEAATWAADLLVVGSRGRGSFRSSLLGSVSAELVDQAPCPVLIVRGRSLERVILAEDGSAGARGAASLLTWPIFRASHVRVLTVSEATRHAAGGPAEPLAAGAVDARKRYAEGGREWATDLATGTSAQLAASGLAANSAIREGDAAREIVAAANEDHADLVVMGTRGRTGFQRLLLGSVARNVLQHAHCSVLIKREARTG